MMPDVIRAGELARRDATVPALLEAMEREVAVQRVGARGIQARMADVAAATTIRAWVEAVKVKQALRRDNPVLSNLRGRGLPVD